MATVSLSATPRSTKGKGFARKLRQTGEVPAVIYGHSREPQSLSVNSREVEKLLTQVGSSTVIEEEVKPAEGAEAAAGAIAEPELIRKVKPEDEEPEKKK